MTTHNYCTKYGRAISPGRVTRASLSVRRTARGASQSRPLPFALQVHPKALSPTSRNPRCNTVPMPHGGLGVQIAERLSRDHFLAGRELAKSGRFVIKSGETVLGRHDDVKFCMAWRLGALSKGVWCDVYEE